MSEATQTPDAVEAEAQGLQTVTIEWRDLTPFEIPMYRRDWPFMAVVALERQEWPAMLSELLPPSTLAEIRAMRLTENEVVGDFMLAMLRKLGFRSAGE